MDTEDVDEAEKADAADVADELEAAEDDDNETRVEDTASDDEIAVTTGCCSCFCSASIDDAADEAADDGSMGDDADADGDVVVSAPRRSRSQRRMSVKLGRASGSRFKHASIRSPSSVRLLIPQSSIIE